MRLLQFRSTPADRSLGSSVGRLPTGPLPRLLSAYYYDEGLLDTTSPYTNEQRDREPAAGIVGLGGIGVWHSECALENGVDLAGGVDVSGPAREEYEREFGVPTFDSFDALLREGVDAVIVTTPNRFHEEYVTAALDAGVHVLCEKPLAHTVESAERIATAAESSDATLMVGFNYRFERTVETGTGSSHRSEQAYFFDCIAEGREPDRNTVEQGLAVKRIIDAIYTSSVRGRAVHLDENAAAGSETRAFATDGGTPD